MAEKQLIISISREYGSGGHVIGEALAKKFDLPVYDRDLLKKIASEDELMDASLLEKYDETPRNSFFTRTVRGYSSSPAENIAYMQFEYLKKMAANGDSFIAIGRCSEYVLKDFHPITLFILSDAEAKAQRIMGLHDLDQDAALERMKRIDKQRRTYHNYYSPHKWGDSRYYDLSINSARLGIEATADYLESFIRQLLAR